MPSVLIIDDDQDIRNLLKIHLKKADFSTIEAESGEAGLKILEDTMPDIILLDVDMEGLNGFEVSKIIRSNQKFKFIYIIFLTARADIDNKILGLNIGGDDYITKPFEIKEIIARLNMGMRHLTERRNANFDSLTGLYNRHFFNIYLNQVIENTRRYEQQMSLIILDIDFFKKVNDTHGHAAGDIILKETAKIFNSFCRKSDIACRWGGEEFVLLLPNTASKGAIKIADRIRVKIESNTFPIVKQITASLGVSEYKGDVETWFQNADTALYKAKEGGRNRVDFI